MYKPAKQTNGDNLMKQPSKQGSNTNEDKKNLHRLSGYDESETNYLIQCYKNSFYLGFVGELHGIESKNLKSANRSSEITD